jgi:hypothetical protein
MRCLRVMLSCEVLISMTLGNLGMYDCYDTKCRGEYDYNHTLIMCDNYHNYCNVTKTGNRVLYVSDAVTAKLKL